MAKRVMTILEGEAELHWFKLWARQNLKTFTEGRKGRKVAANMSALGFAEEDGRFPCFRQTKYTVDGLSLAPVGGYVEDGEAPLVAARRELLEEVGYESDQWTHLGSFPVDANRGAGNASFFLAEQARFVGHSQCTRTNGRRGAVEVFRPWKCSSRRRGRSVV